MATVDRVLPWRRHTAPPAEELAPVLASFRSHHPKASTGLIMRPPTCIVCKRGFLPRMLPTAGV